jgi:hypothetical protein
VAGDLVTDAWYPLVLEGVGVLLLRANTLPPSTQNLPLLGVRQMVTHLPSACIGGWQRCQCCTWSHPHSMVS